MSRRYLMIAILIGTLCGVAVVIGMTGLSGRSLFGAGGGGAAASITPSAAGGLASPDPAVGSPDPGSASTAAPTGGQSTESPVVKSITAKVGRAADRGTYRATTAVASLGDYITWRMVVDRGEAGKTFGVEIGVRLDGTWTSWTRLTSRVAAAQGSVVFSWRQKTPSWIRVRFVLPTGRSMGLQGRWR